MPWLTDRNLGPGDYSYPDQWEVKATCGFVPQSSVFKSSSERDLFDNEGFHRSRLGRLRGPQTPKRVAPEMERTHLVSSPVEMVSSPVEMISSPVEMEEPVRSERREKGPEQTQTHPQTQTRTQKYERVREQGERRPSEASLVRERFLKRTSLAAAKQRQSSSLRSRSLARGRSLAASGARPASLPGSLPLPSLRPSTSAPTIGLHTARWDLNGKALSIPRDKRVSIADEGALRLTAENKRLYRVVRDCRTGIPVRVPVARHSITTPNSQDVGGMTDPRGEGGGPADLEMKGEPQVVHLKEAKEKAGGRGEARR